MQVLATAGATPLVCCRQLQESRKERCCTRLHHSAAQLDVEADTARLRPGSRAASERQNHHGGTPRASRVSHAGACRAAVLRHVGPGRAA